MVVSPSPWKGYNIAISMCETMTIEGYDGERVLLSYDVSGAARTVAARGCQIIFGRVRISEGPAKVRYREKGFIHRPGGGGVGQSGLVLPPSGAKELSDRLGGVGGRVAARSR